MITGTSKHVPKSFVDNFVLKFITNYNQIHGQRPLCIMNVYSMMGSSLKTIWWNATHAYLYLIKNLFKQFQSFNYWNFCFIDSKLIQRLRKWEKNNLQIVYHNFLMKNMVSMPMFEVFRQYFKCLNVGDSAKNSLGVSRNLSNI